MHRTKCPRNDVRAWHFSSHANRGLFLRDLQLSSAASFVASWTMIGGRRVERRCWCPLKGTCQNSNDIGAVSRFTCADTRLRIWFRTSLARGTSSGSTWSTSKKSTAPSRPENNEEKWQTYEERNTLPHQNLTSSQTTCVVKWDERLCSTGHFVPIEQRTF